MDTSQMAKALRDWGNTNPVKRAVAGFVPGVGQALDVVDVLDPDADFRTRMGHVATMTPWGKVAKIAKALRRAGAPTLRLEPSREEIQDLLRKDWESRKRIPDMTDEAVEAAVLNDTLRNIRRAAVPVGLGLVGTAAGAKYLERPE